MAAEMPIFRTKGLVSNAGRACIAPAGRSPDWIKVNNPTSPANNLHGSRKTPQREPAG
jgi:hypothetical protein